ncbi:MAG TPA: holo-ACP synthase [Clostridiales bacterium]|nr:holo-ACP synthase [Clostridiales bacterium]
MEISVGTDLEEVARVARWLFEGKGLDRLFTDSELAYAKSKGAGEAQTLTGLYCAREAFCKAVGEGVGLLMRREMEIVHEPGGRPSLRLWGETAKRFSSYSFSVSISHSKDYATATVIAWRP